MADSSTSFIRNPRRDRFTVVGRELINDSRLSFRARGVLIWLLDKPDGWHFNSEAMAREAKEGREAIRTALRELADLGYIVRSKEQDARGHWLTFTEVRESPTEAQESVIGNPGSGCPALGSPGAIEITGSEDCERTKISPSAEPEDDGFDAFWALYPRKVEKKDALRAWNKARKNAEPEVIIRGLNARTDWWKAACTEMRHIPHAASWLNGERWNDEIEPVPTKPTLQSQNPALLANIEHAVENIRSWIYFRDQDWWAEHADHLRACLHGLLSNGYEFGEIAVRVAIQWRKDRRAMERPGSVNFALCAPLNQIVSRFTGEVPEIFGMEPTYVALMDRAFEIGSWHLKAAQR